MSDQETVKIYADGGSRGNPGPAGAGAVIIKGDDVVEAVSEYLGRATNNVAEYTGLVRGLERAQALGFQNVEVRMDSELVVKQMNGEYRVKHPGLIPLFQQAKKLASVFREFKIVHVRREENKRADALANRAMDAGIAD